MTTLITSRLHRVAALRVAPQEAVLQYKDSKLTPGEIAAALGVKALVRASVFPAGRKIRMTATLSDPFKMRILWTDTLEEEEEDTFVLQSQLCQAIVQGIKVAVTPQEASRLTAAPKVDPAAVDLYMQGLNLVPEEGMTQEELHLKELDYFQRAIDLDPSFALAYAWKGLAYLSAAINQYEEPQAAFKKAKEAALKALELDEDLTEAHSVLAAIRFYLDWDVRGAESEYQRALDLGPGNESLPALYEQFLAYIGKFDEAIARYTSRMRVVKALRKAAGAGSLVELYACAGRYDDALELQSKAFHEDPGSAYQALWLAVCYSLKGRHQEALFLLEALMRDPVSREDPFSVANHARVLALSGRRLESLAELERLTGLLPRYGSPEYFAAAVYAALGDRDKAFALLNQCYESRWPFLVWLRSAGWFHSIHGDPRFNDLIRKMGFPET